MASAAKITRAQIALQPRRLRRAVQSAAGTLQQLPGFLLTVELQGGAFGRGEAPLLAPPPGGMAAVLSRAQNALAAMRGRNCAWARKRGAAQLAAAADGPCCAALLWALDGALSAAEAQLADVSLAQHFARRFGGANAAAPLAKIRTNALAAARAPNALAREVARLVRAGEHSIKIKIGALVPARERVRLAAAREAAGPKVALRFDANCAWVAAEAGARVKTLRPFAPEYVEQPAAARALKTMAALRRREAAAADGVSIAADESARNAAGARAVLACGAADLLVLKPAALGTAETAARVVAAARARKVRVLFSSLYCGAPSLRCALALAAALRLPGAHGLGTAPLLAGANEDAALQALQPVRGEIPAC